MIAAAHPGKHGDALYALPTIRALCEKHGTKCDFYTSAYCEPLRELFEYQDCIENFYVPPNYNLERMDMGCVPFYVPIDTSLYESTYQLGYQYVPDCSLPEFIAKTAGVKISNVKYQVPEKMEIWDKRGIEDFIVIAPRGETSYKSVFQELIYNSPVRTVLIGSESDTKPFDGDFENAGGLDYLTTTYILSKSKGFTSIMSSQLVLANGFSMPKVVVHDGLSWDMRHPFYKPESQYLINPKSEDIAEALGI